ncbi:MAG: hypothetical protein IKQ62_06115 [Bacteroidaceae bacterium]|nr:hypothetical protein [Bacteroidaceae bacterium]
MKKNYIAPEADSYLLEECSMVCNTGPQSENKAVSVKTKAASNASALSNERNMGVSSSSSSAFGSLWE